jgi:hypothetical protein
MIFGLLYSLVRSLLDLLVVSGKTDATVRAEVLAFVTSSASSNARSIDLGACLGTES